MLASDCFESPESLSVYFAPAALPNGNIQAKSLHPSSISTKALSMHFLFACSAYLPISNAVLPSFNGLTASYTNDLNCSAVV